MNQADIQQINDAIKNGNINAAKRLLREADDPRAAAMLDKLNKKYPTQHTGTLPPPKSTAFPMTKASAPAPLPVKPKVKAAPDRFANVDTIPSPDDMAPIKLAILEKRYDDAESLLILSDHPDAEKLRERLASVRSSGGGKTKTIIVEEQKDFSTRLTITSFLLFFFTIFGLVALSIYLPDAKKYPDAPGAGGLLLLDKIVRFVLYGILFLIVAFLVLLFVSYLTRPSAY
jgi:hypothetical protein